MGEALERVRRLEAKANRKLPREDVMATAAEVECEAVAVVPSQLLPPHSLSLVFCRRKTMQKNQVIENIRLIPCEAYCLQYTIRLFIGGPLRSLHSSKNKLFILNDLQTLGRSLTTGFSTG